MIRITYIDGSTQTFAGNQSTFFTIDEQTRLIYIIRPKMTIRIPFESIKYIEEIKDE